MLTYGGLLSYWRDSDISINSIGSLFTAVQNYCNKSNIYNFEDMQIGYKYKDIFYPITSIKETKDSFVFYTDEINIRNPKTFREVEGYIKELYSRLKRAAWMLSYSDVIALKILIATESGQICKIQNIYVKNNKIILEIEKEG